MAASVAGVFEENLQSKITSSKILVVGAGGIGCEVLKNLVLCGFKDIEIIDLDTIDVSNLNRQFLFHKEHVGKSKAEVARQSALSFNPNVEIKAYHDSIFSTDYGVTFFQRFGVVLNALDNRAARNHVNRMCLNSNVPLLESGTAGYNGQVELIKRGETECYECTEKPRQKSFPGCTIRNTPSEPIHCIVWAKHLFNQLFGESNDDEDVSPDTADPEATSQAGDQALSSEATKEGGIERVSTRKWAQINDYSPEKLFNKMFHDDIKYLLSMANLWTTRQAPTPIKWGEFPEPTEAPTNLPHEQKIWSMSECAEVFSGSLASIKEEFAKLSPEDHLVWDKDDKHAMDFVAACANIRSQIFNIPKKSRFEVKSMAGNIIPAIATTNAITAGIVVMQAFRVLKEEFQKCRSVYVRLVLNGRNQLLVPDKNLVPPNPKCMVCSSKPEIVLKLDTKSLTVKYLRDEILIKTLNMVNPDVIHTSRGTVVLSSEDGETDCNNDKILVDLSVTDGCVLEVDDFFQNYNLHITILHKDVGREDASPFEVIADPSLIQPQAENGTKTDAVVNESDHEDDCIEWIEEKKDADEPIGESAATAGSADSAAGSSSIKSPPKKRKTEISDQCPLAKRSKTDDDSDDDLILIEDD